MGVAGANDHGEAGVDVIPEEKVNEAALGGTAPSLHFLTSDHIHHTDCTTLI